MIESMKSVDSTNKQSVNKLDVSNMEKQDSNNLKFNMPSYADSFNLDDMFLGDNGEAEDYDLSYLSSQTETLKNSFGEQVEKLDTEPVEGTEIDTLTNEDFIKSFFDLSEEEKINFIGQLSEEEYNQLLAKIQTQYEQNISDYDQAIKDTKDQIDDIKILLSWVADIYGIYEDYYQSVKDEVSACFFDTSRRYELDKYGITEEDIAKGLEYVMEKAFSSELVQTNLSSMENNLNEHLQMEIDGNENYQLFSGMTYSQILAMQKQLENGLSVLQSLRSGDKNSLATAEYDLLIYSKDYQDFLNNADSVSLEDLEGLGDPDKIKELVEMSKYLESVANGTNTSSIPLTNSSIDYLTILKYLYYKDPTGEEAKQLLKDIDQVFKFHEGAIKAVKEIEQLGELIDSDKVRDLYDQIDNLDPNNTEQVQAILDQIKGLDIKDKKVILDLIDNLDLNDKENLVDNLNHILDEASGLQKIKETLAADLNVSIDGLGDGIYDFFEGFAKLFKDGELSVQDYKVMLYVSYLEQHSNFLDEIYQTSSSIGNLLPTVTLSVILNTVCPGLGAVQVPVIGGTAVSNISLALMSLSAFGTTQNQLKFQDYADWQAYAYAILASGSTFLFQRFGGILGLSNSPGSNFIVNWLKEGGQQVSKQMLVEVFGNAIILGQDIDITNMGQEAFETFLTSLIISGAVNMYTKGLTIVANGIRYQLTGADSETIAKYLDTLDKKSAFSWEELGRVLEYRDNYGISLDDALILNQAVVASGYSPDEIMNQQTTYWVADSSGNSSNVTINSFSQWKRFIELKNSGMTEQQALETLLDEYANSCAYDGWVTADDIKTHVREAYDRLPDGDKKSETNPDGLSFEEFLKIKLQLIPYDPATQTPIRYAEVQQQMVDSGEVTCFWSEADMIRFLNGTYGNGIGRPANGSQDSALFVIPSSEVNLPPDFSSWPPEKQAAELGKSLGLDPSNFQSGTYKVTIDESIYQDNWTYSDPYTQGSNQDYVPGMNTSNPNGKTEVVVPRVEGVVQSMDSTTQAAIDAYFAAGMVDEATDLFFQGVENGTIILRPGVSIEKL